MRTIVYYEHDGEAALKRVMFLRGVNGPDAAQAIKASAYAGERIKGDELEFLPCVPGWHRVRIEAAFEEQKREDARRAEAEARKRSQSTRLAPIESEDDFRRSLTSRPTTIAKTPEPKQEWEDDYTDLPVTEVKPNPFDHDGDGKPGGSLPAAQRGLDDLRAEYEAKYGRPADKRWGEKRFRKELGE